ncbi:hypothetical protein J0910_07120 [Nocardiopsis sp. CNT-189]|uniref:hypothetical protein n=1 Tax=Nocardiopsis oceanisediminis TaxID=2816862 RepID=UPI003B2C6C88
MRDPQDPRTNVSDDVLYDALHETASRAAGAYMRKAEAAATPEAKEEAKQQMLRAWRVMDKRNLSRDEMISLRRELQAEIDRLRGS